MKITAAHPAAQFMGLPARKKKIARTVKPKLRKRNLKTPPHFYGPAGDPCDEKKHKRTIDDKYKEEKGLRHRSFAELLEVAGAPRHQTTAELPTAQPPSRAMPHRSAPAACAEAPRNRGQLTPAARRIIELGAEARGQTFAPDGIEAQLKRELDDACGIGSVARQIINRMRAAPQEAKRLDREIRAQRQRDRDAAFGITPAARAIIDRVESRA